MTFLERGGYVSSLDRDLKTGRFHPLAASDDAMIQAEWWSGSLGEHIRRPVEPPKLVASRITILPQPTLSPSLSPNHLQITPPPTYTISSKMSFYPTFHVNNFKPWIPSHTKSLSSHKPLNSPSPMTNTLPHPKLRYDPLSSTLPVPKSHTQNHPLPARPPAAVCVHTSANTRPCTPLRSPSQRREISVPPPSAPHAEVPRNGITPPRDPGHPSSSSDPDLPCDFQEVTYVPIEPPFFRGDAASDASPSPSVSSLEDTLEEFLKLAGEGTDVPIDPVILADDGSWEASELHQAVQQDDGLVVQGAICPYPEPPPIFRDALNNHQDSSEGPGSQDGSAHVDDRRHSQGNRQLHLSHHSTETDTSSFSDDPSGDSHCSKQSRPCKRRTQRSDGRSPKRRRASSTSPGSEVSFTALCTHFISLPLDERLQFLSWLFEGALSRCMPDTVPTTCEDGDVRSASHRTDRQENEQTRNDRNETLGSSRKGMPWSAGEVELLLKLKRDERRTWSEVTKLFSEQYTGRSKGSIQVYWSTTLKNMAE